MSNNYGITESGFNPKTINELEDDAKLLLQQVFGLNVDLSQYSSLWKIIQVMLTEVNQIWVQGEENFYNCFIQTAEGVSLDLLGEDVGLTRKQAISAEVTLTIYKNSSSSVTLPEGSLFETSEGIIFVTEIEITIPAGDPGTTTGSVNAIALEPGITGNVASNTIIVLTNSISGIDSSDNSLPAEGGADKETDSAYRKRLRSFVRATWTRESIRSAALNVEGVAAVKVIEYSTSYDLLVVPQTVFDSALQAEIENAIEPVTPITVEFQVLEAKSINIYVVADIVVSSLLDESTAESQATTEISEYINSLGIDDDVIKSKIIQAIMEVVGIENVYNVLLTGEALEEEHTYVTGTDEYQLDYSNGDAISEVTGTLSGSPHTFIETTDYVLTTSPATIEWQPGGDSPDNGTIFKVTYTYPGNTIGDIVINQTNIAKLAGVDFTIP